MEQKVFITYQRDGVPANALEVVLGSNDASYGIRKLTDNTIVVPNGTAVTSTGTGQYEYAFDADQNAIYRVSWKITADADSAPEFVTQDVGPFTTAIDSRVMFDLKGTFTRGTFGTVYIRLYDLGGSPFDADSVQVKLTHQSSGQVLASATPLKLGRGIYVYDWAIPDQAPVGQYDVVWTYRVRGATHHQYQRIVVNDLPTDSGAENSILALFRVKLEMMLQGIQELPIYGMEATVLDDYRTYGFPFKLWNQSAGVRVFRNGTLLTGGYEVDYLNGRVIFDTPNLEQDVVACDFVFRFFSDEELELFLRNGLGMFNLFPPHSPGTSFVNLPDQYVPPVLHGAMMEAISALQQALTLPQNRVLYRTEELADKAFDRYETIRQGYEKRWEKLGEQKKYFPYRGTIATVVQSVWTLPGGRSRFFRYLFGANAA